MSSFEMIPESAYEEAQGTREQQFVHLARVARSSLDRFIERDRDVFSEEHRETEAIKSQFVGEMSGLAEELGIKPIVTAASGHGDKYTAVQSTISNLIAKYRLRDRQANASSSLRLSVKNKAWLRQELEHLIKYVEDADLPKWKRAALLDKLQEAVKALDRERLSYATVMAVLVPISAVFGTTMTGIAQAPKAIEAVHSIIARLGADHAANEEEQLRLEGPPRSLTGPDADDLDDDVPF
jgi:hypothetical protein